MAEDEVTFELHRLEQWEVSGRGKGEWMGECSVLDFTVVAGGPGRGCSAQSRRDTDEDTGTATVQYCTVLLCTLQCETEELKDCWVKAINAEVKHLRATARSLSSLSPQLFIF